MVHGNYYGVQYEIYLNKEISLWDDVLPICSYVKKMLTLEKVKGYKDKYKLVVIPYNDFDKRLKNNDEIYCYIHSVEIIKNNSELDREKHKEDYKYYDVAFYKDNIKHAKYDLNILDEDLYNKLESNINKIKEIIKSDKYWKDYSMEDKVKFDEDRLNTIKNLRIQRIIRNPEYLKEIKEIEQNITNIELTDREKEIINMIINHPNLKGTIESHGINIIEGKY